MELKEQLKEELLKQKEEKLQKEKEINSKLKKINLYTTKNHATQKQFVDAFTNVGIKFKEHNLQNSTIRAIVQLNSPLIIEVNGERLAYTREFTNPQQAIGILRYIASPDYVLPPTDERIIESIKNLTLNFNKTINGLNRQLQPILKLMNDLAQEEAEEKKANEQKNN